ncbi:MAG TPA: hypothetical protein VGF24_10170 [Vicinamibacterales bacterium]
MRPWRITAVADGPLPSRFTFFADRGANSRSAAATPPSLGGVCGGSPGGPGVGDLFAA